MRRPLLFVALAVASAGILGAADTVLELDPAMTEIHLTLHDVLHTVHGSFKLKRGTLRLDPDSNRAAGEIVVDVASGNTGSGARDKRMHREILESQKYPEAVFVPDRVEGRLAAEGESQLAVHGVFRIHGAEHELTLQVQVQAQPDRYVATCVFEIPYVKWGMKNPSNFLLKVDDKVAMAIQTVARR